MKKYGIRITLPPGDTMHSVLGENWEVFRWFDTPVERDKAYEEMLRPPPYYRAGDAPTQVLEKVESSGQSGTVIHPR